MGYLTTTLSLGMLLLCLTVDAWLVAQPHKSIWVMLAKTLLEEDICSSMGSADNSLATCLVGIPLNPNDCLFAGKKLNPVDLWDEWMKILPRAPEDPQELELLESSQAICCIRFSYKRASYTIQRTIYAKDVSPSRRLYQAHNWCNYAIITPLISPLNVPESCQKECS